MESVFSLSENKFHDFSISRTSEVFRIACCGCAWKEFQNSLKFVSELKYRTQQMQKGALSNSLPEYQFRENCAEMTYYEGEPLHNRMPSEIFFAGLDAICYTSEELTQLTGKDIGMPLSCILCDMQTAGIIHFLYLDFSPKWILQYRKEIAEEITAHLKQNRSELHPEIRKNAGKIINLLLSPNPALTDWQILSGLSRNILEKLQCDDDYFLYPFPEREPISQTAERIHQTLAACGGQLYLQAEKIHQAEQAALHYAACYQNLYVHFACGDASSGLDRLLKSDSFRLHSGIKKAELCRRAIQTLCQEKTLLILSGFSPESAEDNLWLSRLSCADILFAVDTSYFNSVQDFADYGSAYFII